MSVICCSIISSTVSLVAKETRQRNGTNNAPVRVRASVTSDSRPVIAGTPIITGTTNASVHAGFFTSENGGPGGMEAAFRKFILHIKDILSANSTARNASVGVSADPAAHEQIPRATHARRSSSAGVATVLSMLILTVCALVGIAIMSLIRAANSAPDAYSGYVDLDVEGRCGKPLRRVSEWSDDLSTINLDGDENV